MKVLEDAVNDALVRPLARMAILFICTWLAGSLYRAPETFLNLVTGREHGYSNWIWVPGWFNFRFFPVIGAVFSKSVLVSGPLAAFCVTCSALDRLSWVKLTVLLSLATFSMNFFDSRQSGTSWVILTLVQAAVVAMLFVIIRPLRET
ncbi:MAG: hypothetical protein EOP88_00110 [Verrucomicrobiaceae bacterium]|nr:MAG: hypothetical protein EOP88_00110 [Verrucomicrobiaceae bacterium]